MKTVLTLIFIFSWVGYVQCAQDAKNLNAAAMAVAVKSLSISELLSITAYLYSDALCGAQALQDSYKYSLSPQNLAQLNNDMCDVKRAAARVTAHFDGAVKELKQRAHMQFGANQAKARTTFKHRDCKQLKKLAIKEDAAYVLASMQTVRLRKSSHHPRGAYRYSMMQGELEQLNGRIQDSYVQSKKIPLPQSEKLSAQAVYPDDYVMDYVTGELRIWDGKGSRWSRAWIDRFRLVKIPSGHALTQHPEVVWYSTP